MSFGKRPLGPRLHRPRWLPGSPPGQAHRQPGPSSSPPFSSNSHGHLLFFSVGSEQAAQKRREVVKAEVGEENAAGPQSQQARRGHGARRTQPHLARRTAPNRSHPTHSACINACDARIYTQNYTPEDCQLITPVSRPERARWPSGSTAFLAPGNLQKNNI